MACSKLGQLRFLRALSSWILSISKWWDFCSLCRQPVQCSTRPGTKKRVTVTSLSSGILIEVYWRLPCSFLRVFLKLRIHMVKRWRLLHFQKRDDAADLDKDSCYCVAHKKKKPSLNNSSCIKVSFCCFFGSKLLAVIWCIGISCSGLSTNTEDHSVWDADTVAASLCPATPKIDRPKKWAEVTGNKMS